MGAEGYSVQTIALSPCHPGRRRCLTPLNQSSNIDGHNGWVSVWQVYIRLNINATFASAAAFGTLDSLHVLTWGVSSGRVVSVGFPTQRTASDTAPLFRFRTDVRELCRGKR